MGLGNNTRVFRTILIGFLTLFRLLTSFLTVNIHFYWSSYPYFPPLPLWPLSIAKRTCDSCVGCSAMSLGLMSYPL